MSGTAENTGAAPGPRVLRSLETVLLVLSVISILSICGIIAVGVVTRALFSWSLPDAEIMVRDLMIASIILPLAYVTADRAHIAVDVFVSLMPDSWGKFFNLLGSIIGFLVLLPIAYGGWKAFQSVWLDGSYFYGEFDLPEWPGKFAFFLGYLVFVLRLATLIYYDTVALFRSAPEAPADAGKG